MKGQQEGIWGRAVLFPDCGGDCTIYRICQNPQNCTTTIKYILLFVIKKKKFTKRNQFVCYSPLPQHPPRLPTLSWLDCGVNGWRFSCLLVPEGRSLNSQKVKADGELQTES